jgi:hypothetical protein
MKFSKKWFRNVSDEEFYSEREPIRQRYCEGDQNAERLLYQFDKEEIRRLNEKYEEEHPNSEPRHREHGWYLSNDD